MPPPSGSWVKISLQIIDAICRVVIISVLILNSVFSKERLDDNNAVKVCAPMER